MGSTSDLKVGAVLKYNNEKCVVLDFQHVQTGRGGAYYQTKMRNIKTGKIAENRYRSGETIEFVTVSRRDYQYLYKEGNNLCFMDVNTYDQIYIPLDSLGEEVRFLKENETVNLSFDGDEVLAVNIPLHVNLRVIQTEPGLRGDTATNVLKPATLESGAVINVPLFINEGDIVRLDSKTGGYIERVKE